jgi:hypothetical protein
LLAAARAGFTPVRQIIQICVTLRREAPGKPWDALGASARCALGKYLANYPRWRDAAILGTLMNTQGLMELIVERRAGLARHHTDALCDDGVDGPRDHDDDSANGADV